MSDNVQGLMLIDYKHHCCSFQGSVNLPSCPQCHLCVPPLPNTSTRSEIHHNRCRGQRRGHSFHIWLAKDWRQETCGKKRIQDTKGCDLSPLPDFCQDCMKNGQEGQKTQSVVNILIPACPQSVMLYCAFSYFITQKSRNANRGHKYNLWPFS